MSECLSSESASVASSGKTLMPTLALTAISACRERDRPLQRDADGGRDLHGDVDRGATTVDAAREVGEQDQELVAALARDDVLVAHDVPEAGSHLDQQVVADGVAETVVDELESVQIDEAHGDARVRASGSAQRNLEMLAETAADSGAR